MNRILWALVYHLIQCLSIDSGDWYPIQKISEKLKLKKKCIFRRKFLIIEMNQAHPPAQRHWLTLQWINVSLESNNSDSIRLNKKANKASNGKISPDY